MADEYNGGIDIPVRLTPKDVQQQGQKIQKAIQSAIDGISTQKLEAKGQKIATNLTKVSSKMEEAGKKLETALDNTKLPTQEFAKLNQQIEDSTKKIDSLKAQMEDAKNAGFTGDMLTPFTTQIETLENEARVAKEQMQQLVDAGKAFTFNEAAESVVKAKNAYAQLNNEARVSLTALSEYTGKQDEIAQKHSEEVDAMAQQLAKMLEIKLNAGEINSEIGDTLSRVREVESELEQLNARQQELEQAGAGLGYEEYDKNLSKIRELEDELSNLNQEVSDYRDNMSNMQEPISVWDRVKSLFSDLGNHILHPIKSLQELNSGISETGNTADIARSKFSNLSSTLGRLSVSFIGNITGINRFKRALSDVINKANQSSFSFKKLFNTLLKYGIGVRSLFVLYRKIRSAIAENIKYYALMNNGMNETNYAMSALQSSLNALKGALAGAFVPIITTVSPILSNLIDQLASVITAIGMFIAKLTGAKSYLKAVKKDTDYAAGLSSGGGSSNKKTAQEKYEEAVAKAQKKYEEQLAKVRERNAKAETKAEEKQAKAAEKLAKQQEKANKQLATYDKLNVINKEDLEDLEDIQADLYDEPELELPNREDFEDALSGGGSETPFGFEEVPLDGLEWNWDDLKNKAEELGRDLADTLNDFFKNEDWAKELGHNIAEALNTALHFAYGFIDELDWRQMGRWFGTLIQEGIETFEWDLLGKTLGKLLNGVADTIIGFFERYNVGTLGQSIATMFNNAINEIDTDKVGEAIGDVLGAPIAEFTAFLKEADIRQATEKAFALFERVLTAPLFGGEKTLGYIIGEGIAAILNAAFDFVMGSDITGAVSAVKQFLTDIFKGAFENIDIISYLEAVAIYCIDQAELVYNRIVFYIREILTALSYIPGELGDLASQGVEALSSVNTKFDEAKQAVHDLADSYRQELPSSISEAKDALLENSDYIKVDSENTAKKVDQDFKTMAGASNEFKTQTWRDMLEATNSINEYSTNTNTQLDGVQTKSQETAISLEDMATSVNESLGALTTTIDTWYQEMITTYFGYDAWYAMLQQGVLLALNDFINKDFFNNWDVNMKTWWETKVKPYFSTDKWNKELFTPWKTNADAKWQALMSWFDSQINSWWDNKIKPMFEQSKWSEQFNHVKNAAEETFSAIEETITNHINNAKDAVKEACEEMLAAIAAVQAAMSSIGAGGGGFSSSGASTGWHSATGGSSGGRFSGFMPMLDVMHFEDNLGMSAFQFPELATGAVIPPNNRFLAVLGDQRSGTNIETPLNTMIEAFNKALDQRDNSNHEPIVLQLNSETIAEAVWDEEEKRYKQRGDWEPLYD